MASLKRWLSLKSTVRRHSSPETSADLHAIPHFSPPQTPTRPAINTDIHRAPTSSPLAIVCEGLVRVKERNFVGSTKKWLWLKLFERDHLPPLLGIYQPGVKSGPERLLEKLEVRHVERVDGEHCTLEVDVVNDGKPRKLLLQFSVEWSLYVWLEEIYSRCPSTGIVDYDSFSHDMHIRIDETLGNVASFTGFPQSISEHFQYVYENGQRASGSQLEETGFNSSYLSGGSSNDTELLTPVSTLPPGRLHVVIEENFEVSRSCLPQDHIGYTPTRSTEEQLKHPQPHFELPSRHTSQVDKSPSFDHSLRDLTDEIRRLGTYPVASGGFSDIYKGLLPDHERSTVRVVGIKVIRAVSHSRGVLKKIEKRLYSEIDVWQRLHHPNIVELLGISRGYGSHPALVSWWYDNGHVMDYLETLGDLATESVRIKLLLDIARGLAYLHSFRLPVVHGDLKGSNVLVNAEGVAMLTDFGLSSIFEDLVGSSSLTGSNSLGFSVRWLAVELVRSLESDSSFLRFTPSTDVYSFGSTMLEVLTGRVPYHNRQRDVQVIMDIYQGARHQREDTKISIPLWDFMEHCWSETPDDRPYSNQLVRQLEQHYKMAQL